MEWEVSNYPLHSKFLVSTVTMHSLALACILSVCTYYDTFLFQILCLEKSLEEMLTRVDEFVGMLDMVS